MTATKVGPGFVVSMVKAGDGRTGRGISPWSNGAPPNSRGFAEFLESYARDREEFERFMDEHRNQQGHPSGQ
jgi:hypothetical protein